VATTASGGAVATGCGVGVGVVAGAPSAGVRPSTPVGGSDDAFWSLLSASCSVAMMFSI